MLLSLGTHAVLFAALLVVCRPASQRSVTPPPDATHPPSLFRVGVWSPASAAAPPGPAPVAASPRAALRHSPAPREAEPAPTQAESPGDAPPASESVGVDVPAATGDGATFVEAEAGSEPVPARWRAESQGPGGVASGGSPSGGERAAPGADVVGLVHARLAAGAQRCYPAAARRYQQRGTAEVRFCVDASGGALETSVVKTSGSSLLDAAVGDCVLPAASPFPASAQGHCFTVPVRFGGP
jgi:TonB family protein